MLEISHKTKRYRSHIVRSCDPKAAEASQFISEIYKDSYQAIIAPTPDAFMICESMSIESNNNDFLACAGLSFGLFRKQLFSEKYLNYTADRVFSEIFGSTIHRKEIVEIGSLASRRATAATDLIRILPVVAWFLGMRAIICTATLNLRRLFEFHKIPFTAVTEANITCLSPLDRSQWGEYYESCPQTGFIRLDACSHLFSNQCGRYSFADFTNSSEAFEEVAQ